MVVGLPPGEQEVGQRGERELVGPRVQPLAEGLLGRDVGRGAADHGEPRGHVHRLAEPEVAEHRDDVRAAAVLDRAEQHVGRLHVTVQDAAVVQRAEAPADLGQHGEGLRRLQRRQLEPVGQRALVGVRHHEERALVGELAGVVDRDDVGRLDLAQEATLLDEALADVQVAGPVVGEHLDRHGRVEVLVVGEPHGREGPRPDATAHRIPTETRGSRHPGIIVQG